MGTAHDHEGRLELGGFKGLDRGINVALHTYQGENLGQLYLPLHGLGALYSLITTQTQYENNPLE
jgi:hypothetical protein